MSDTNSELNSPTASATADDTSLTLSGTLKGESIVDKKITISNTFKGSNLSIQASDYAYSIAVAAGASCELTDCDLLLTSSDSNDSAVAISLAKGSSTVITGGSVRLRYGLHAGDGSQLTISGAYLGSPTGRFYLYTRGATTLLENLEVEGGALLQFAEDSRTLGYGEGYFTGRHITFGAASTLQVGGSSSFLLEDCTFRRGDEKSTLIFSRIRETEDERALNYDDTKIVRGCNLSNVSLVFRDSGDGKVDFSGNYWGEGYDTVEKVLAKLGDVASDVVITSVLTEDPVAPQLTLLTPTLSGVSSGKGQVTLSWASEEGCTSRLLVDDKEVYSGTALSHQLALAAGDHTYTVIVSDKFGNYRVHSSSLTLDVDSASLSATKPAPVFTVLNTEASGDGSLAWAVEQANAFKGQCRIVFAPALSGQELALTADALTLHNAQAQLVAADGLLLNLSLATAFTTSYNGADAPVCFQSTAGYTKVNIGSPIIETPISLSNLSFDFSAGNYDTVTITAETSMEDCSFSGSEFLVTEDFTGSRLELVNLTNSGFHVQNNATATLTDCNIHIDGNNNNIVSIHAGSFFRMDGGSVSLNTRLNVSGLASFWGTSFRGVDGGRFYLLSQGITNLENLDIAEGSYLQCYGNDTLTMHEVLIGGGTEISVSASSNFSVQNSVFAGGTRYATSIKLYRGTGNKSLNGCNLAGVSVRIMGSAASGESRIDLSGNYWGEGIDTLEEITALIRNYDASCVIINDWLTEDPAVLEVSLNKPTLTKVTAGKTQAKLSWKADEGCSYRLLIDGQEVYSGTKTSFTTTLAEGKHTYEVQASKGPALSGQAASSFTCDTKAPTLTMSILKQKKISTGKATLTLGWTSTETASYVVKVDGKVVYSGKNRRVDLELADGVHKYSIQATDAAGNVSTKNGSYRIDTKPPTSPTTLKASFTAPSNVVTFTWNAPSDISGIACYEMALRKPDGSNNYYKNITTTTKQLTLPKDATYKFAIRAKDKKGNYTAWVWSSSFVKDYKAPKITFVTPTQTKASAGKVKVTFGWTCDEKASFTLQVDGKTVYRGAKDTYAMTLADGTHKYTLTAKDSTGKTTKLTATLKVNSATAKSAAAAAPVAASAVALDHELGVCDGSCCLELQNTNGSALAASASEADSSASVGTQHVTQRNLCALS